MPMTARGSLEHMQEVQIRQVLVPAHSGCWLTVFLSHSTYLLLQFLTFLSSWAAADGLQLMESNSKLHEQYEQLEDSYGDLLYLAVKGTTGQAQESGMALAAAQQVLPLFSIIIPGTGQSALSYTVFQQFHQNCKACKAKSIHVRSFKTCPVAELCVVQFQMPGLQLWACKAICGSIDYCSASKPCLLLSHYCLLSHYIIIYYYYIFFIVAL